MAPRWEPTEFRRGRSAVSALRVHLVFVTKYRRGVLTEELLDACASIMREVCAAKGAELLEFNGEDDHVHLLVAYPPSESVSELVNRLKGVSSRLLRRDYDIRAYQGHLWSPSYFASSAGGASLDVLKDYIRSQRRPCEDRADSSRP